MKRFFALTGVLFFLGSVLCFTPCSVFALNPQPEPPAKMKSGIAVNESYIGTIVKIEGNKITVRNETGAEKIITGNFPGLKPGSRVKVTTRDGRTWLNPQPEPPVPLKSTPVTQ